MGNVVNLKRNKVKSDNSIKLKEPLSFSVSKRHRILVNLRALSNRVYNATIRRCLDCYDRMESTRLLGLLMATSLRLNRDNFSVKMTYYGVFNSMTCFAYLGGEKEGKEPVRIIVGKDHGQEYRGNLSPKKVREAIKALNAMSKFNDLYCDRYHGRR